MSADGAVPPRRRPSPVPAAVGAAAALLALSTLGLTWVSRTVQGPLGDAGAAQVEQLSGRDVAPLVAALVPGVTAVVVVALLLRGWWRVGALVVAALGAGAAAASAGGLALGDRPDGGSTTAVPVVATLACLLVAGCALAAAVGAVRDARDAREVRAGTARPERPAVGAPATAAPGTAAPAPAATAGPAPRAVDGPGPRPAAGPDRPAAGRVEPQDAPGDLWRALDEGRDPTGSA